MLTGHIPELLIVLVIALIVFGPQRLPEVTGSLGKAVREFRRATSELEEAVMHHADEDDTPHDFPHIPPAPDTHEESTEIAPTIDTLAQRREARQARKSAMTASLKEAETGVVSDGPTSSEETGTAS